MSTKSSLAPPAWLPRTARPYSRLSQLWQVPTFLVGVLAVVLVAGGAALRLDQQQQEIAAELHHVRQLLQRPRVDLPRLLPQIERLVEQSRQFPGKAGEAHFLLATALLRRADEVDAARARELWSKAVPHLQQAEVLGVRPADRPRLWYMLGKTQYQTGGDLRQAISYLSRSLPRGADNPLEGYGLLVQAYLKLPTPDVDAALKANEQQLRLTGKEDTQFPARLLRGELLIQKKQFEEAGRVLERIGPKAPEPVRLRAAYLLASSCEAQGLWKKAAPLWQELLKSPTVVPGGKRRVLYALGNCYHNFTPAADGLAVQTWTEARTEGGMEGQAASLRLAELFLFGTPRDFDRGLKELQHALAGLKSAKDYDNKLIPLAEVQELIRAAVGVTRDSQAFAPAQQLAELYKVFGPPDSADLWFAEITDLWAAALEQQAGPDAGPEAEPLHRQARAQWQRAAQAYRQAAAGQKEGKKTDLLWRTIECYGRAHDVEGARSVLQEFLGLPTTPERRAEGWFVLAEAQRHLGQKEEAWQAYLKCLEYPTSPCAARARYQIALAEIDRKQFDRAEEILKQNRQVTGMQIDREAHEQSLYRLATLLYQRKNFAQANLYLREAVQQYPANAQAFVLRDFLGDCHRQLALQITQQLANRTSAQPPETLAHLRAKRLEWLEKAADVYQKLADELEWHKGRKRLLLAEEENLRKALFATADIHFEMNNFPEALRRYNLLAKQFQGKLEELYVCQRLWLCCKALERQPQELRQAMDSARVTLRSIRETLTKLPDAQFQGPPGTWSRADWQRFADGLEIELQRLATALVPPAPPLTPPGRI